MSWFARSLVNTLRGEEEEEEEESSGNDDAAAPRERSLLEPSPAGYEAEAPPESDPLTSGLKEDLSELTRNLTRGLWGVASFLAPSPSSPRAVDARSEPEELESLRLAGIRSDLEEIGGKLKSGISILSNTMAVSEISKFASSILSFESDKAEEKEEEEEDEKESDGEQKIEVDAVGLTEDVAIFARNITMHRETWLNFPLLSEQDKSSDFEMSAAQIEHTSAVERIAPRLVALRSELCPSHMSEGCFWKIYFVLLHSRLSKDDAELLSTQQILEARATLLQESSSTGKPSYERSIIEATDIKVDAVAPDERFLTAPNDVVYKDAQSKSGGQSCAPDAEIETEKYPVEIDAVNIVDKSVVEVDPAKQCKSKEDLTNEGHIIQHEVVSNWSEEETGGNPPATNIPVEQEEDISFSVLEDDDDEDEDTFMKPRTKSTDGSDVLGSDSSQKTNETNDWLEVDNVDFE